MEFPPRPSEQRQPKKKKSCSYYFGLFALVFGFAIILYGIGKVSIFSLVSSDAVGILPIEGPILDMKDEIEKLREYAENPSVKAIVLEIDSPGGAVAASQELYDQINKVRNETGKPVIASFGNIAASGGYYVACAADEIVSNPGTLTGSIGVILSFPNWEELVRKIGIEVEVVKSGEFKDIGSPTRPLTEDERKLLLDMINDVYDQFFQVVLKARFEQIQQLLIDKQMLQTEDSDTETTATIGVKEIVAHLKSVADGRIFSGRQALDHGLVDVLGSLNDAVNIASDRAGISGKARVIRPKKELSIWDLMSGKLSALDTLALPDSPRLEYRLIIR